MPDPNISSLILRSKIISRTMVFQVCVGPECWMGDRVEWFGESGRFGSIPSPVETKCFRVAPCLHRMALPKIEKRPIGITLLGPKFWKCFRKTRYRYYNIYILICSQAPAKQ